MSITLVDIKNHLFSHFLNSSVFNLKKDAAHIKLRKFDLDDDVMDKKEEMFRAALEDFKRVNIVAELGEPGSGLYMLTQSLNTFPHSVSLTPITSEMVADLVNGPGRLMLGNKTYTANKLSLTDTDLQMVVSMCHMLLHEGDEVEKQQPPPPPGAQGQN